MTEACLGLDTNLGRGPWQPGTRDRADQAGRRDAVCALCDHGAGVARPGRSHPGFPTPFWLMYDVHDALVKPMPGNNLAPSLAESWRRVTTSASTNSRCAR